MKILLVLCCSCMLFLSGCNMAPEKVTTHPEKTEAQFHGKIISTFTTDQFSKHGYVTVTVWEDFEGRIFQTTVYGSVKQGGVAVLQLK